MIQKNLLALIFITKWLPITSVNWNHSRIRVIGNVAQLPNSEKPITITFYNDINIYWINVYVNPIERYSRQNARQN